MNDETYDYEQAVRDDIREYLEENVEGYIDDEQAQDLYDEMFVSDSVTGNGSGSYTLNTYKAESNLCHNLSLLSDAEESFGGDPGKWLDDPEGADVVIRCHILGQVWDDELEKWNDEHPENDEDDEANS